MLDEIIDRSKKRGNNEQFISRITEVYYDEFPKSKDKVIYFLNLIQFSDEEIKIIMNSKK